MKQRSLKFDRIAPAALLIEVSGRFDEAGWTLARLPGVAMQAHLLPEMADELDDDRLDAFERRPTAAEISRMDETFTWIGHLPPLPDPRRVLILKRLLRNAVNGKYRYSWRRLGKSLDVSHHTAKAWHAEAIELIARKVSHPQDFPVPTSHFRPYAPVG